MQSYIINDDVPPDAIVLPGEEIELRDIRLSDVRGNTSMRHLAAERGLAIYREMGGEDTGMENAEVYEEVNPTPKPTPCLVRRILQLVYPRAVRFWRWNICFPAKAWLHLTFKRGCEWPSGQPVIQSLLREAFAQNGITDRDIQYHDGGECRSGLRYREVTPGLWLRVS